MTTPSLPIDEFLNSIFPDSIYTHTTPCTVNFVLNDDGVFTPDQREYLQQIGIPENKVQTIHQIHSDIVLKAPLPPHVDWEADGIVTDEPGVVLTVRSADCLPVFIFDPVHTAIGLVHAGWQGTKQDICPKTLNAMFEAYGTKPEDLIVAFGPSISSEHYEVGPEFKEHFYNTTIEEEGKLYFDMALANQKQLIEKGVRAEHIHNCEICTYHNEMMYSHRRQGKAAGRFMSIMMIKDNT